MEKNAMMLLVTTFVVTLISRTSGQLTKPCDSGPSCLESPSRASYMNGEWMCCPPGFAISASSQTVDWKTVTKCECTRLSSPNGSQFGSSSVFVSNTQGGYPGSSSLSFQTGTAGSFGDFGSIFGKTARSHFQRVSDRLRQAIGRISGLTRQFQLWKK